jgi:hypothetical protein
VAEEYAKKAENKKKAESQALLASLFKSVTAVQAQPGGEGKSENSINQSKIIMCFVL